MSSLEFVNINGDRVNVSESKKTAPRRASEGSDEFHKGWLVSGIPPGALDEAEAEFKPVDGRKFDRENWLMNAKKKRIRARPYELRSAAEMCAELARRSGWLSVTIQEMKREKVGN